MRRCGLIGLMGVLLMLSAGFFQAAGAEEVLFEKEWKYGCMESALCGDAKEKVMLKGHKTIVVEYTVYPDDSSQGCLWVDLAAKTETFYVSRTATLTPGRDFIELRQSYDNFRWFFTKHNRVKIIGQ